MSEKYSLQKLDVPQWQAQAHWLVYIKKVCSGWDLTKKGDVLKEKLCSFLNKRVIVNIYHSSLVQSHHGFLI